MQRATCVGPEPRRDAQTVATKHVMHMWAPMLFPLACQSVSEMTDFPVVEDEGEVEVNHHSWWWMKRRGHRPM